jgi:methyltransferase family protein
MKLQTSRAAVIRAGSAAVRSFRDPTLDYVPPGHFFSPVPGRADREAAIAELDRRLASIPGVELHVDGQMKLLERLARWYEGLPFSDGPDGRHRYHLENPHYSYTDGIVYACLLQELRPARVVEVGCGWSSALLLDVDEEMLGGGTDITFVEPHPQTLKRITRPGDLEGRLRQTPVQAMTLEPFTALVDDDILFIDSTHVARCGSDVNYLFFEVLPRLNPGVYVHVHDVFYPFEYPVKWLREGRSWNEDYLLRAFLQFNSAFEIVLFADYMVREHKDWFAERMPKCLLNSGGNIWLRRNTADSSLVR